jgi:chromosome segregation ATPase
MSQISFEKDQQITAQKSQHVNELEETRINHKMQLRKTVSENTEKMAKELNEVKQELHRKENSVFILEGTIDEIKRNGTKQNETILELERSRLVHEQELSNKKTDLENNYLEMQSKI